MFPRKKSWFENDELGRFVAQSWRQARRIVVIVIGTTVVLLGVAFIALPLPGPAPVTILAGLAILGTEVLWARRLRRKIQRKAADAFRAMSGRANNGPKAGPPLSPTKPESRETVPAEWPDDRP